MAYKTVRGLKEPDRLVINFKPSPKQYELWQLLQPNRCNLCGGEITQIQVGTGPDGSAEYKSVCAKCGNQNLPQMILAGGAAGGGKTYLSSCWIVSSCLRFPGIRAVIARKTLKSLKESVLNTVKKVLMEWGLEEGVNYKINNLEGFIQFYNGSVILMKELGYLPSDESWSRLGSSEYSIAAVEECNECEMKGVEVLMSRLRWMPEAFRMPKLLLTCNPCLNWPRARFVKDKDNNPVKLAEGEFYCPFTVDDNPDESFRRTYIAALNRISDPVVRRRLRYGDWDVVESNDSAAYWGFGGRTHLKDELRETAYDPLRPVVASWDFNVAPYMSCLLLQFDYDKKTVYVLEEILGEAADKTNNTQDLAKKVSDRLVSAGHIGGVMITGDPSGTARSTQTREGTNNYTIIKNEMSPSLHCRIRVATKQPPQVPRLEFVNAVFQNQTGWKILIDMRCRRLTEDLVYQKKNDDGTKEKKRYMDPTLGVKCEKYGHLSDCLDYALCQFLSDSWQRFRTGSANPYIATTDTPIYGSFDY